MWSLTNNKLTQNTIGKTTLPIIDINLFYRIPPFHVHHVNLFNTTPKVTSFNKIKQIKLTIKTIKQKWLNNSHQWEKMSVFQQTNPLKLTFG